MSESIASPFAAPSNTNHQQVNIDLGDRSYPIEITVRGLENLCQHAALPSAASALIVSNNVVWPLYGAAL